MSIDESLARARELLSEIPAVPATLIRAEEAAVTARSAYAAARATVRDCTIAYHADRTPAALAALTEAEAALAEADAAHRSAAATQAMVRTAHAAFIAKHIAPTAPVVTKATHELIDALEGIADRLTVLRDLAHRHGADTPRIVASGPDFAAAVRNVRRAVPA